MKYALVISASKTKFGPVVFREDIVKNILKTKAMGYDGIEFAIRNAKEFNLKEVIKVVEKFDLSVPAIGTGQIYFEEKLSFSDTNEMIRNEAVRRVKEIIDISSYFNSAVIIGLVRGNIDSNSVNYKTELVSAELRIAHCLQKCIEYSEKYKTIFLIEPLIRYNSNIFNKIEDVKIFTDKYQDKIDISRIGILADTYHMNVEEQLILKSFKDYYKLIKHIHFSDSNRLAPGLGHIDFTEILKLLKQKDYKGFVSFEILPLPDSETAARIALANSRNFDNS